MEAQVTTERLRRSVNALERLHAVIIGLALTLGAQAFMGPWLGSGAVGSEQSNFPLTPFLLFGALFITIIPFYHGATRHLDHVHLSGTRVPTIALPIDYFLLFLEGVAFVSMGLSVYSPTHFFWAFAAVLAVDTVWGVVTLPLSPEQMPYVWKWLLLDVCSGVSLVVLWLWVDRASFAILICVGALVRTVIDYRMNWHFFFDTDEARPTPAAARPAGAPRPAAGAAAAPAAPAVEVPVVDGAVLPVVPPKEVQK